MKIIKIQVRRRIRINGGAVSITKVIGVKNVPYSLNKFMLTWKKKDYTPAVYFSNTIKEGLLDIYRYHCADLRSELTVGCWYR